MRLSKFLKEQKVYKKFKNNFNLKFSSLKEGDTVLFNWAFDWNETTEGFVFWNNIDDLWRRSKNKHHDLVVKNGNIKRVKD